ncbi:MAG: GspE/PulE family protein [Patescibacteria group bacterium]
MKFDDKKIKQILLKENYVTEEDIRNAESFTKTHPVSFTEYLLKENLITKDLLGQTIAESFGLPYADLNLRPATTEQVNVLPEDIAKKYRLVVFWWNDKRVIIATDDPGQPGVLAAAAQLYPKRAVSLAYALPEDVNAAFIFYQKPLETRFGKIIEGQGRIAPELLEEIFGDAIAYHASDIHFEPQQKNVLVRFRIDGVLHVAGRIPKEYYENILNRIKVQSGLLIDEHFAAQDGSLRYEKDGSAIDMRISIVPTIEGEKAVLRILAAYAQGLNLLDLGLSPLHQELLKASAKKPFGMILVTGPTGSGKTTTLYALVKLVNSPDVNITTIEDPVEYKVLGINQIQINPQTDLTFAKGLRSIVRQDPDIILVGEIRDNETAEISINAALTGHLLYSTFHANDSAAAIPRLLDMGVEPFLLASTLEVIIAQRLVRKICDRCRYGAEKKIGDFDTPQFKSAARYFPEESITLYQGKGCASCSNTGYRGRTAIFEFIQITPDMQNLILRSPSSQEIWSLGCKEGAQSLFEDGILKVRAGITTLEELLRVAEPPQQK